MTDLIKLEKQLLWHPFTPMQAWCAMDHEPLLLTSGQGCKVIDQHGRIYLDGNSSIWTNIHGHNHPTINGAIKNQLDKIAHTSFLGFSHAPAIHLAQKLIGLLPGNKLKRVFYSDDGSTAIECAVRMSLQYWKQNGHPERDTIISFDRAYHGDTLGAASLGGIPLFKGSGNEFGYRTQRVPNLDVLNRMGMQKTEHLAAVIIEPLIQGSAGMRLWPSGMLKSLSSWCQERNIFLILDEVMTGFGRTGTMFACQQEDVIPDFLCLAKGLTGGYLPMAATLTTERVFEGFNGVDKTFYYGHSYTANQLGCAAALASLDVFEEEQTLQRLDQKIEHLRHELQSLSGKPMVHDVRQCGLIAGVEIKSQSATEGWGAKICLQARRHGLLTRPIGDTVVLMPPLSSSLEEISQMVDALSRSLNEVS